jgi:hypothetical protein
LHLKAVIGETVDAHRVERYAEVGADRGGQLGMGAAAEDGDVSLTHGNVSFARAGIERIVSGVRTAPEKNFPVVSIRRPPVRRVCRSGKSRHPVTAG